MSATYGWRGDTPRPPAPSPFRPQSAIDLVQSLRGPQPPGRVRLPRRERCDEGFEIGTNRPGPGAGEDPRPQGVSERPHILETVQKALERWMPVDVALFGSLQNGEEADQEG